MKCMDSVDFIVGFVLQLSVYLAQFIAYIVSIPKPGKDATDPSSPIALTSCLCKVMERIVNNRLVWYLKSNKLITPTQSGFRKGRSSSSSLLQLCGHATELLLDKT